MTALWAALISSIAILGISIDTAFADAISLSAPKALYSPDQDLHIRDAATAKKVRATIVKYIWKNRSGAIPAVKPYRVSEVSTPEFHPLKSEKIGKIIALDHVMHLGLSSRSYLFVSKSYAGCLFVFHSGHGGDPIATKEIDLLDHMLDQGCDLIVLRMPLTNGNPRPTVPTVFGHVRMTDHGAFALLDSPDFSPIRYFMQPIAASINYAVTTRRSPPDIVMAGMSGGGWATTVYAAIDPRIRMSFPMYGSLPLALRDEVAIGDWEQTVPGLYKIAGYLDLYALATFPKRSQTQMLNVNDTCCFAGRAAESYVEVLAKNATAWGGTFKLEIEDGERVHSISARHSELIRNMVLRSQKPTIH